MHPELAQLLDLQQKDQALLEVDRRLAALLEEEDALNEELRTEETKIDAARRAAEDATRRADDLQARLEQQRTMQERRKQRLEFVRNPREASELMAELDLARSVLAQQESDWVRAAETAEGLTAKIAEVAEAASAFGTAQLPVRAGIAERRSALEAERDAARVAREASAQQLTRPVRMRYDRLRKTRTTEVVVALAGVACGACFTSIPMSRRGQLRDGYLLEGCEACGVILYAAEQVEA
jgi:predicted  nucleic acid-binding Zn-ribbon protein